MANPKILPMDISWITSLSASAGSGPSYPITNLQDYEPDTYWGSNALTNPQHLWFDLAGSRALNCAVLGYYDFYDDAGLVVSMSGSTNNSTWTLLSNNITSTNGSGFTVLPFTAANYRYIKINMVGLHSAQPFMGLFFVGYAVDFTTPYELSSKTDNSQYETSESITLDGRIRTSQVYDGRYVDELTFKLQDATWEGLWNSTVMPITRGKLRPFFFIDADGTARYMHFVEDYIPITNTRPGRYDVSIKMREHLTTR